MALTQIQQLEALLKSGSLSRDQIESIPHVQELKVDQWWMTLSTPRRRYRIMEVDQYTLKIVDWWGGDYPYYHRLINRYLFEEDIATGELIHGNS